MVFVRPIILTAFIDPIQDAVMAIRFWTASVHTFCLPVIILATFELPTVDTRRLQQLIKNCEGLSLAYLQRPPRARCKPSQAVYQAERRQ
jgi:hypothetical protein